jgi:choline-sulfatase
MLFHIGDDPLERHDLIAEEPGAAEAFRTLARSFSDPERIEAEQARHRQKIRWFRAWEEAAGLDESERWQDNPPTARLKPELCIE